MASSDELGVCDVIALTAPNVVRWWTRMSCAKSFLFILSFILVSITSLSSNAFGQGTSGTFADPIGLIEFTDLLKKNGVEYRDQYAAVEAAHVKYLESCLELRDQQIQRFQEKI